MTLRIRVSRLDDYAGELTQTLRKLEAERELGALSRDEEEDFLADLRKAVQRRDLRPPLRKALVDLLGAAAAALAAGFLPRRLDDPLVPQIILAALGALALVLALRQFLRFLSRSRHDRRWLGPMEAALARGGTIFDPHDGPRRTGRR